MIRVVEPTMGLASGDVDVEAFCVPWARANSAMKDLL